jgi:hypothetical protein
MIAIADPQLARAACFLDFFHCPPCGHRKIVGRQKSLWLRSNPASGTSGLRIAEPDIKKDNRRRGAWQGLTALLLTELPPPSRSPIATKSRSTSAGMGSSTTIQGSSRCRPPHP